MILFQKTPEPQLDMETAGKILEQAFAANDTEPNTTPLDVLTAYSNYRRERFTLQRSVLVVVMVLFLLLPFLFIPPSFTLSLPPQASVSNPVYRLQVDTFMLVERITATIDGHSLPVYEVDSHVYSIEPTRNGRMEVTLTLINHQTQTQYIEVDSVDLDAPTIVSNQVRNGLVYLYLSDPGSGIHYEEILATAPDGQEVPPLSYDEETGCVIFRYPEQSLNVYIPDYAGNALHLILTVQ